MSHSGRPNHARTCSRCRTSEAIVPSDRPAAARASTKPASTSVSSAARSSAVTGARATRRSRTAARLNRAPRLHSAGKKNDARAAARGRPRTAGAGAWPGVSMGSMSALPVDPPQQEDPLDPGHILRVLPERERETFLAEYRRAVDGAHDPAGWPELRRFLRLWAWRAIAVAEPGYYEARERARAGTGGGMLLEDALRQYRPGA